MIWVTMVVPCWLGLDEPRQHQEFIRVAAISTQTLEGWRSILDNVVLWFAYSS